MNGRVFSAGIMGVGGGEEEEEEEEEEEARRTLPKETSLVSRG